MANSIATKGVILAALVAVLYQFLLRDFVKLLGITREMRPIAEFPYSCRRMKDPTFAACEDMWYDDANSQLYLACSTVLGRAKWIPNMAKLDAPSSDNGERVVVVDVEKPTGDTYQHRVLTLKNFDSSFHALSITGNKRKKATDSNKIDFYLINNKPTLDINSKSNGHARTNANKLKVADNTKTGANTTIEVFEHTIGSDDLVHVNTYAHPLISTPNNIAVAEDGGIFFTNDHGLHKTGIRWKLSIFLKTANVVHCKPFTTDAKAKSLRDPSEPDCKIVAKGHSFPNGILIPDSHPNLLFVASAGFDGVITIYDVVRRKSGRSNSSNTNRRIDDDDHPELRIRQKLRMPMPVDNLSFDRATNSIYAAGIANALSTISHFDEISKLASSLPEAVEAFAHKASSGSSVLRIFEEKSLIDGSRWVVETVLEDHNGSVLPGLTTTVRDGKGTLWNSGVLSPFITVCDVKGIVS